VKASLSRGEARKRVIAHAALELFLERGFSEVTLDDVAQDVGASKQTIYRFFGDRSGLIRQCLENELERVMQPLRDVARDSSPAGEKVPRLAEEYQRMVFAARSLRIYRFVLGDVNSHPELGLAFTALVTDTVVSLVANALIDAYGFTDDEADLATDVFLGTLQGKELNRALAGLQARPDRLMALRELAIRGVAPHG
jgi:TetR/AcrR family transcriptional regulator, mexJK operon transcriptional repressor